jgi:riboflavin transporter FmnP
MNTNTRLNKLIKIALLGAIAAILMFIEIPIIPAFGWLKLDFSELPVLMGGFAFGPIAGVVIELIKIIVKLISTGSTEGWVGLFANFIIGVSFVVPAAFIYHRKKSKKSAIIGMIIGTLFMEVVAILANLFILLPAYGMPMEGEAAVNYVLYGLLPLNSIKAISVSILTYIIYKKLSAMIFKVDFESKRKIKEN